jgi:hypothetical protein
MKDKILPASIILNVILIGFIIVPQSGRGNMYLCQARDQGAEVFLLDTYSGQLRSLGLISLTYAVSKPFLVNSRITPTFYPPEMKMVFKDTNPPPGVWRFVIDDKEVHVSQDGIEIQPPNAKQ